MTALDTQLPATAPRMPATDHLATATNAVGIRRTATHNGLRAASGDPRPTTSHAPRTDPVPCLRSPASAPAHTRRRWSGSQDLGVVASIVALYPVRLTYRFQEGV